MAGRSSGRDASARMTTSHTSPGRSGRSRARGVGAPAQDADGDIVGQARGQREQVQRAQRPAAHGVDVGKAVRRADATEEMWIVHARREDIHGLNQTEVLGDAVNAGVVTGGEAGNHRRVFDFRQAAEHGVEIGGRDLRGAAGVVDQLGELHRRERRGVRPLAGAGADALVGEDVARAGPPDIADAMAELARTLHDATAFGEVNFHVGEKGV